MSKEGDDVDEPYEPFSRMLHSVIAQLYSSGALN